MFGCACDVTDNLEAKILWLKNYERVQEIQQQIFWRPITELEPRAFIPEVNFIGLAAYWWYMTLTNRVGPECQNCYLSRQLNNLHRVSKNVTHSIMH